MEAADVRSSFLATTVHLPEDLEVSSHDHDAAQAVSDGLRDAKAANTRRVYQTAWHLFCEWTLLTGRQSMPAEPQTVALYLGHLNRYSDGETPQDSIESVIVRRGSARRFSHESITLRELSTVLEKATQGIPADFLGQPGAALPGAALNDIYLIVNTVDDLPSGARSAASGRCQRRLFLHD